MLDAMLKVYLYARLENKESVYNGDCWKIAATSVLKCKPWSCFYYFSGV